MTMPTRVPRNKKPMRLAMPCYFIRGPAAVEIISDSCEYAYRASLRPALARTGFLHLERVLTACFCRLWSFFLLGRLTRIRSSRSALLGIINRHFAFWFVRYPFLSCSVATARVCCGLARSRRCKCRWGWNTTITRFCGCDELLIPL